MCALHANSAREAVVKMCTLPLLAGENIGTAFVVPTLAASVDLVVHVGTDASGHPCAPERAWKAVSLSMPGPGRGASTVSRSAWTQRLVAVGVPLGSPVSLR